MSVLAVHFLPLCVDNLVHVVPPLVPPPVLHLPPHQLHYSLAAVVLVPVLAVVPLVLVPLAVLEGYLVRCLEAFNGVDELKGINDMLPQLDYIIEHNKWLDNDDIPMDEKYLTAYMIANGVNSANTPPPDRPIGADATISFATMAFS